MFYLAGKSEFSTVPKQKIKDISDRHHKKRDWCLSPESSDKKYKVIIEKV